MIPAFVSKHLSATDWSAIGRLYREELPQPVDVLNLLHFRDRRKYQWYALAAAPAMRSVGAELGWAGDHVAAIHGEPRAEELLVVRYPSHRRFLAMVLNPYYLLVANPQRLRGVRHFEASFTAPATDLDLLRKTNWALVAHFNADDAEPAHRQLTETLESLGLTRVYASSEAATIDLTKTRSRAAPNPLQCKETAIFWCATKVSASDAITDKVLADITPALRDLSLQLYHRRHLREMLPFG